MKKKLILLAPLAVVAFLLLLALGGLIVQALWNWLLPALFGWHQLTFWQALGMLALCRILFGGIGGRGTKRSRSDSRVAGHWARMTPEEKERFRQKMRERFGLGSAPSESPAPEP
jgi:hypothetical protein